MGQPRECQDWESIKASGLGKARYQSMGARMWRCEYVGSEYEGQSVRGTVGKCKVPLDESPEGGHSSSEYHPYRRKG